MEEVKKILKQIETLPLKQLLKRETAWLKRKNVYIKYKNNYYVATKYIVGEDFAFTDIKPSTEETYCDKVKNGYEYYILDLFK